VIDDPFLRSQAELDQDDFPIPWPDVDVAEGPEREALRQELLVRARNLLAIEHAARDPAIKEHEAPLSRLQLDLVLATPNHHAELMRREEDRCFRQFARLGNLMVKFQTHAEKCAKNEGASGYVDETKERRQDHSDENAESERGSAESDVRSPRSEAGDATPGAKLETQTIDSRQSNIDPGLPEFQSAEPLEVARAATPGKSGDSKFKIQDSGQVPGTNPPRGRPEVQ
jgi:hypothetical protein